MRLPAPILRSCYRAAARAVTIQAEGRFGRQGGTKASGGAGRYPPPKLRHAYGPAYAHAAHFCSCCHTYQRRRVCTSRAVLAFFLPRPTAHRNASPRAEARGWKAGIPQRLYGNIWLLAVAGRTAACKSSAAISGLFACAASGMDYRLSINMHSWAWNGVGRIWLFSNWLAPGAGGGGGAPRSLPRAPCYRHACFLQAFSVTSERLVRRALRSHLSAVPFRLFSALRYA